MRDHMSLFLIFGGIFIVGFLAFYDSNWLWAGINAAVIGGALLLRRRELAKKAA